MRNELIIETGKYVGEGFDNARLDILFLVMPISWKGKVCYSSMLVDYIEHIIIKKL
ncbi:hypothetical protein [Clostridium tepidiprofundi]|uniref:hypothetical protein n=1 Tax=Clostridium tepidiprofundi TaxID=420412 RepID=UPI000B1A47D3|nr:hypothetical protein [Clostridium tepidiprofundi]